MSDTAIATPTISPTLLSIALARVAKAIKPEEDLCEGTHPVDVTLHIFGDIVKGAVSYRTTKTCKVKDADVLAILLASMDATAAKRAVGSAVRKIAAGKDVRSLVDVKDAMVEHYADKHGLIDERETTVSGRTTGAPLYDVIAIGEASAAA